MSRKTSKERVDLVMVQNSLAESRKHAQSLIMSGAVYHGMKQVLKPGQQVEADATLEVRQSLPYVSRGGLKLAHALDYFNIDLNDIIALDIGSSTGGFTDCMLQRGASTVYAIDVGHGQLHYRLRQDPRVISMEGINARYEYQLPHEVHFVTIDVSFISATKIVPSVNLHLEIGGYILLLVKPQFEAQRDEINRGGIIKNPMVHARVLGNIVVWAVNSGYRVRGLIPSPILGSAGNKEFLLLLQLESIPHNNKAISNDAAKNNKSKYGKVQQP